MVIPLKIPKKLASVPCYFDDADLGILAGIFWVPLIARVKGETNYARGFYHKTSKDVLMHRFIMGLEPGDKRQVDHINHNGLDNRRSNLRVCTPAQNKANTGVTNGPKRQNISGFKGVSRSGNQWQASIIHGGKTVYIGSFKDKVDAAEAYNRVARNLYGEFAFQNQIV